MRTDKLVELASRRCNYGPSCPAIFKDGDHYVIIGERKTPADFPELEGRIGADEDCIEIDMSLVVDALVAEMPWWRRWPAKVKLFRRRRSPWY